jgi:RNase P subunit RPR2
MEYGIRFRAEIYEKSSGKIIKTTQVYSNQLPFPKTIDEFGLRHAEQIKLIKASQDVVLKFQTELLNNETICPKCKKQLIKKGKFISDFHDVFTDHQVTLQRFHCHCGWKSAFTVQNLYGNASHPELIKLQTQTGAMMSYEKASHALNAIASHQRKINNDSTILNQVNKIGSVLNQLKLSAHWIIADKVTDDLVVAIDGGHVQNKAANQHSFEELIATAYLPESIIVKPNGDNYISERISVASAKKDQQRTIKQLTINACKKLGMTDSTEITVLTDGASNCWSVANALHPLCKSVKPILDWFHIAKHFKSIEFIIPLELKGLYDKAKWHCWHGRPVTSLVRLNQVIDQLLNKEAVKKIRELIKYILNNQAYFINYHNRRIKKLPFTSQLAECSVNSILNERQKNQKMQWTRDGAHHILQIRTSLFSKSWNEDWHYVKQQLFKIAI